MDTATLSSGNEPFKTDQPKLESEYEKNCDTKMDIGSSAEEGNN